MKSGKLVESDFIKRKKIGASGTLNYQVRDY